MSTERMNISAAQVKELRERSGAPMMDCKNALSESKGDIEQALVWLRKKGIATAAKKAARVTSEGSVASYIHAGGKIGVLVEINCESDFVARTEDFKELVKDRRKLEGADLDKVADGRVFTGRQAIALKLADEIGGIESLLTMVGGRIVYAAAPFAALVENTRR